jgi:hypothetical protein
VSAGLRQRIAEGASSRPVQGHWQPISVCVDQDAGEFLNVGVVFSSGSKVEVRMLDNFDRMKCLYDRRFDQNDFSHYLLDIEEYLYKTKGVFPEEIDPSIRLGTKLFAAGASAEAIVNEYFEDVVTLARPKGSARYTGFRYTSTPKLRENIFQIMKQKMHMAASAIIKDERYRLKMRNGAFMDVDTPLLSSSAAGSIVSAWYKSPLVVSNNILQGYSDLMVVSSNSDRKTAMSILVPDHTSGLDPVEYQKLDDAVSRQIDRIRNSGVEVIAASSTDVLANKTIDWWSDKVA